MPEKTLSHYRQLPYTRRIEPREDSDGTRYFVAWIDEIPFVKIDGATREEAFLRLSEIFDECILGMLEMGDQVPEPALWPLNLGMPPATDPRYITARPRPAPKERRITANPTLEPWTVAPKSRVLATA
jgi:predicted RNase H-like HicB family nuclease